MGMLNIAQALVPDRAVSEPSSRRAAGMFANAITLCESYVRVDGAAATVFIVGASTGKMLGCIQKAELLTLKQQSQTLKCAL